MITARILIGTERLSRSETLQAELPEELHYWKGPGLALEELALGGTGDHGGVLNILRMAVRSKISKFAVEKPSLLDSENS